MFLLQQQLPFTVLKLKLLGDLTKEDIFSCNSNYRLRY